MEQKLTIQALGPIQHCELELRSFITLTGFQASGKSTIAKAIYYFRTIKDDIVEIAKRQTLEQDPQLDPTEEVEILPNLVRNALREKFMRTFGSSWAMSREMRLEYQYSEGCIITVTLKNEPDHIGYNYIWIEFSDALWRFMCRHNHFFQKTELGISEYEIRRFQTMVNQLFQDNYSVVYIPAGRSMITVLSQQLSYIYATMNDTQKRALDSCTRDYMERILQLKPEFSEGLQGLRTYENWKDRPEIEKLASSLIAKVLRGAYYYADGEERIILENGKYVKLNFASSGQQESVWILNLLYYYLAERKRILFIIEEPESHLFPASQKYMTEFISLMHQQGNQIVLTTHSPYVLGSINNLLYAGSLPAELHAKLDQIIPEQLWLNDQTFSAVFVKNGNAEDCMDPEIHMIQNERIDEISGVINEEFDRMLELNNHQATNSMTKSPAASEF